MKIHLTSKSWFFVFALALWAGFALAQSTDLPVDIENDEISVEESQEMNISFPIPELGDCTDKAACREYCEDLEHREACLDFAERYGLLHRKKIEKFKKIHEAFRKNLQRPGDCADPEACRTYCEEPEHIEECLDFAKRAGFIPPEQAEHAKKMANFLKNRETPGKCANKEACEEYCHQEENFQECIDFAIKIGAMTREDAERAKKFREGGPGGCRGIECREFCSKEENQNTCLEFAREHNLLPPEEIEGVRFRQKEFNRAERRVLPPHILDCLRKHGGEDLVKLVLSGELDPGIGQEIRRCFSEGTEQFPPTHECLPRPRCLDSEPACEIAEPSEGWCPTPSFSRPPFPSWTKPPQPPTTGCYYKQVQCITEPCPPQLVCPSFSPRLYPSPTCRPRPLCLDTEPPCLLPEPMEGWCQEPLEVPPLIESDMHFEETPPSTFEVLGGLLYRFVSGR